MKEWLIWIITESNPASVLNIVLNVVQIIVTVYAFVLVRRSRVALSRITTDGTRWLLEEAVKKSYDEHFSRLYQRVDALAGFFGKEFICNPETLIDHRGKAPPEG
jgi:hypothetical protein